MSEIIIEHYSTCKVLSAIQAYLGHKIIIKNKENTKKGHSLVVALYKIYLTNQRFQCLLNANLIFRTFCIMHTHYWTTHSLFLVIW